MNGLITPKEHFASDVEPNYREYMADLLDSRKAKNAAISLSHFPEWSFHYYRENDRSRLFGANSHQQLFNRLCQKCPELKDVWEYADTGKHRFLVPAENFSIWSATGSVVGEAGRLKILTTGDYFDAKLTTAINFLRNWIS